jgi:cation diffusion facilitator family transporter
MRQMADCCESAACEPQGARQRATLKIVLAINGVMFVVVLAAGLLAGSTALLADSFDNFGDAFTYALSLWAVSRGERAKARVALVKGALILDAGLLVLGQVAYRAFVPTLPVFEAMGAVSLLALAANGACVVLLQRHRGEDVNMSSVWECARNDIASNLAVFVAAGGVWVTGSAWPDLATGLALAALLLWSAARVVRASLGSLRETRASGRWRARASQAHR